jgi:predicted TIM-barrel fold metal-dependent hydrolase
MMVATDSFAQIVRPDWLALHDEPALHPDWPVIDAHHHIWDNSGSHYMVPELLADLGAGHEVLATVHVEAHAMIAAAGPDAYRCINETEFVNGVAALAATGRYGRTKLCAGIVGQADLRLGTKVDQVLEAHVRAGGGRFRGIRQFTNYDADPGVMQPHPLAPPPGMLGDAGFRNGFAALAARGLSFDACMYFHQLPELAALADAFPESRIILNHTGGPIGIGTYAGRREEIFALWRARIADVARRPGDHISTPASRRLAQHAA